MILQHAPLSLGGPTQLATFESQLKEKMAAERQQKAKRGAPPTERNGFKTTNTVWSTDGIGRTQVVLNVAVDAFNLSNNHFF